MGQEIMLESLTKSIAEHFCIIYEITDNPEIPGELTIGTSFKATEEQHKEIQTFIAGFVRGYKYAVKDIAEKANNETKSI